MPMVVGVVIRRNLLAQLPLTFHTRAGPSAGIYRQGLLTSRRRSGLHSAPDPLMTASWSICGWTDFTLGLGSGGRRRWFW